MQFANESVNGTKMEKEMEFFKYLAASLLLVFSCQSHALFMPDGFKINTDNDAESDGGCGALVIKSEATF
jgi:hypothetical protein